MKLCFIFDEKDLFDFIYLQMEREYLKCCITERLKEEYEKKKTFSADQPKKFSRRCRRKANEFRSKSDERRN